MYSLEYGYVASVSWTISFFTGFFSNVGLIQPLKVTIMAAVMSFFFESHIGPVAPAAYFVTLGKLTPCAFVLAAKQSRHVLYVYVAYAYFKDICQQLNLTPKSRKHSQI